MQKMFKWIQTLCCILLFFIFGVSQCWSTTISFNPSSSYFSLGDTVSIDIVISGLNNENISTFDFNVDYDSSILSYDSYTVSDGLGSIASGDADDWSVGDLGGGSINLSVLSNFTDLTDFSFQTDSFTLANLVFDSVGAGTTSLSLSDVVLGDFSGDAMTASVTSGQVEITAPVAAPVPEPATLCLFTLGLLSMAAFGRKHS